MRKPSLVATTEPPSDLNGPQGTLREIVKQALLKVLNDPKATAAAKASAGRTLLEHFGESDQGVSARGADMSAAELDSAIARIVR
jgi:hypothetical protein